MASFEEYKRKNNIKKEAEVKETEAVEGEIVHDPSTVTDLAEMVDENLPAKKAKQLLEQFATPYLEVKPLLKDYKKIKVTSEDQKEEMKKAREQRLEIRQARISIEKIKTQAKADIIVEGRAIDKLNKFIQDQMKTAEEYLKTQEEFVKLQEAKRKQELKTKRQKKIIDKDLSDFVVLEGIDLSEISDQAFDNIILGAEAAKKQKLEQLEAEKKQQEEQAAENERLKKLQARQQKLSSIGMSFNNAENTYFYEDIKISLDKLAELEDTEYAAFAHETKETIDLKKIQAEKARLAEAKKQQEELAKARAEAETAKKQQELAEEQATQAAKINASVLKDKKVVYTDEMTDKERIQAYLQAFVSIRKPEISDDNVVARALVNNLEALKVKLVKYGADNVAKFK